MSKMQKESDYQLLVWLVVHTPNYQWHGREDPIISMRQTIKTLASRPSPQHAPPPASDTDSSHSTSCMYRSHSLLSVGYGSRIARNCRTRCYLRALWLAIAARWPSGSPECPEHRTLPGQPACCLWRREQRAAQSIHCPRCSCSPTGLGRDGRCRSRELGCPNSAQNQRLRRMSMLKEIVRIGCLLISFEWIRTHHNYHPHHYTSIPHRP